jgi:glycosidase
MSTKGAETFWLSPIYRSPMADFGYDISGMESKNLNFYQVNKYNINKNFCVL